jgi:crotonobetaine/carnitine-CoA ligase
VTGAVSPALGRSMGWLVDRWAGADPGRPFLTWVPVGGGVLRWTRAQFARDVDGLVGGLFARGVRPGDRVALVLPNCPEFLIAWSAVTSLGAVAVCLDPRSTRDDLAYVSSHSGPIAALVHGAAAAAAGTAMPGAEVLVVDEPGSHRDTLQPFSTPGDRHPTRPPAPSSSDPASIQYTSGTTARPKAVVWTQANCLWAGQVGTAHQGLGPSDVNLVHLPLFHTNGLSYSFLASLWSGGQVVLQPKFSASRFWDVSVRHGATWTSVVSFCVRALAAHEAPARHTYRGWGNGFNLAPSPVSGGAPVVGWFGMTETVSHPVVGSLLHPDADGTMGRPAPEYQVAVVDEDGAPVKPGASGELRVRGVRGVSLFAEYLGDAAATADAFTAQGWFRTGDRVRLEESGALTFVERDKDVLKVGGENVGAPEIERVILTVPGVREVAVVGRFDPMLGEVPVAFVTTAPGASWTTSTLTQRCAEMLAGPRRPREVRVVDALPRSTLDKVAKARLRTVLLQEAQRG